MINNVWICKPDGTIQCESDIPEITLDTASEALVKLIGAEHVLNGEKRSHIVITLCGAPTGAVNAFEITAEGYRKLKHGYSGMNGWQLCDSSGIENCTLVDDTTPNWSAWYNLQMPGPTNLHVIGQVEVPSETDGAKLVYEGIEKSNPPNLLLRIIIEPNILVPRPNGGTLVDVHYSEITEAGTYGAIKIILDQQIVKEIPALDIRRIY